VGSGGGGDSARNSREARGRVFARVLFRRRQRIICLNPSAGQTEVESARLTTGRRSNKEFP